MIPIPKGFNKDLSKSQNYRWITLSSLFSKIFDHCIISYEDAALKSDDLQFNVLLLLLNLLIIIYIIRVLYICVQWMHQKLLIVLIYLLRK